MTIADGTRKQPANPPNAEPRPEPKGPRTPYPVDAPVDPHGPGSEPDYFPGKPGSGLPKF